MTLEEQLKKLGYKKWDTQTKPQANTQEIIHRWYKEAGKWKIEYYIKNDRMDK